MKMKEPRITVPDMCQRHQARLVREVGIGSDGPWRSLIIMAQIALFQSATTESRTYKQLGGNVGRISELGCLACYNVEAFQAVVTAAKSGDDGAIKALGDRWVAESRKP